MTVLVSRFLEDITPGALPILPELITIHNRHGGGFIVYRWFDDGGDLQQSAPDFRDTLGDAWKLVPEMYDPIACPEDFARMAFRLRRAV